MAISDLIGKVFSSQFIAGVAVSSPLLAYANNRSAEVRRNGDGLEIPLTQSMVTATTTYPDSDDITYSALSPSKVTLAIDKKEYIALQVEDIDDAQLAFNMFSEGVRQAGQVFGEKLNTDMRSVLTTRLGASNFPTAREFEPTTIPSGGDTAAVRGALHIAILDMKAAFATAGYTQRPVLFIRPPTWKRLIKYLVEDKNISFAAQANRAFVDAQLSSLYGVDIVVDWGATNTAAGVSIGLIPNRTIAYAGQVSRVERMRAPARFATRWRALNTYGFAIQEDRSLYGIYETAAA